jgi:DNA-binding transcriptional ArsR family regulator
MSRRGRKRQLDVETEYWQLLKAGVGTAAACRIVGITRKTGYRWRAENGRIPPVRLAETARTSRYLSLLERQRIATLRGRGHGVREIARRIGRSPSTVSRELRRNLRPHVYDGDLAHARARQRRVGGADWTTGPTGVHHAGGGVGPCRGSNSGSSRRTSPGTRLRHLGRLRTRTSGIGNQGHQRGTTRARRSTGRLVAGRRAAAALGSARL